MAKERVQRRLAAILAADVAGYSRLIEADEEGTRARLRDLQSEVIDPKIISDGGRIVKTTGDGMLVEFPSAVDAVRNALSIQSALAGHNAALPEDQRLVFRIGINVGDVIIEGDDIHGDGVNVAARLEGLCHPGGVYISGSVYDQVSGKMEAEFNDLGEKSVKNISRPVRTYRVEKKSGADTRIPDPANALPLPDKPSIAVLPFQNMSGDAEQEYFSDGISEDIITALSHIRQFFVIARNTTFTYKGHAVDVKAVARDLGVRYVLEGSVRKAANRVRITAQLIDGENGNHLWAERYDRDLEDVFAVQDDITRTVVGAIGPQLESAERGRALKVPPNSIGAWELYHQGQHYLQLGSQGKLSGLLRAAEYFEQAAATDARFSRAWSGLGMCYYLATLLHTGHTKLDNVEKALEIGRRAVELDRDDSAAHWSLGSIHLVRRNPDAAIRELRLATDLNPSDAMAYQVLGIALVYAGDPVAAQTATETALRLSPRDRQTAVRYTHLAFARLHQEDFEGAVEFARKALQDPTAPYPTQSVLLSALGHLGRQPEAQQELAELLRRRPEFTIQFAGETRPYTDARSRDQYLDGLRKAGLPE